MKSYLLFLPALLFFSSCTTAYKSGQTPDDVYFSPQRPVEEYVTLENKNDKEYRSDDEYRDDQYLRMKVQNRRWSSLDDEWYSYNPSYYSSYNNSIYYSNPYFNNYHGFGNYYGSPYYNYYNPYYSGVVIINPRTPVYNKPRMFNLNSYNPPAGSTYSHGTRVYSTNTSTGTNNNSNNRSSGSNAGQFLRNIFSNSGNSGSTNSSNNSSNSSNSSSRSSSGSSSSGSSSSGSGHSSVRRF